MIQFLRIRIKNMSCIPLTTEEDSLIVNSITPCKKITINSLVVAYLILLWLLDPPLFILINNTFFEIFLCCHKLMFSQGPPTYSQPYSINPSPSLYILFWCVIKHLPSQLAPKIQLRLLINSVDQVLP